MRAKTREGTGTKARAAAGSEVRIPDKRWRRALPFVALFAGALVVRLIYFSQLRGTPYFDVLIGDAREYDAWARRIASGQGLGTEVFYQTPLYPYLLATIFKIAGHHLFVVRVLQAVSSSAACVLVAIAGERFFDRRTGLVAGILLAVYPPAIFFDGLIQKSSLDLLLVSGLLCLLALISTTPRWTTIALAGVTAALLSLNRENARVLIPLVAAWLLARRRLPRGFRLQAESPATHDTRWTIVFAAAVAAVLIPVGLRNYAAGGEFLLSTSQAGPNFYIGNHAGASGLYESLLPGRGNAKFEREDARRLAEQAVGRTLSPGEVSSYWTTRALADIRREPLAWLRLMGRKLLLSVNAAEAPDAESIAAYAAQSSLLGAMLWFDLGVLLPLAVLGAWLERARWRQLWILPAIAGALLLSMAAFFVFARYRFPVVPVLALFAAVPLVRLPSLSRMRAAGWGPGLSAAIAVAIVCRLPMTIGADETDLNLGRQLIADERPADAIPLLQRSAARNQGAADDAFTLGVALDHAGDKTSALQQFRRAVQLDPRDGRTQGALALALGEAGLTVEALDHFAASVRGAPEDAALRMNYGVALARNGDEAAAIAELEQAVRLKPGFVNARVALGQLYARAGRRADAVATLQRALADAQAAGRSDLAPAIQSILAGLSAS